MSGKRSRKDTASASLFAPDAPQRRANNRPQTPFANKLVLNQWLLSLFNVKRFDDLAGHLRNEALEEVHRGLEQLARTYNGSDECRQGRACGVMIKDAFLLSELKHFASKINDKDDDAMRRPFLCASWPKRA